MHWFDKLYATRKAAKNLTDTTLNMFSELITRIDKLESDVIEANSKLDAQEQDISNLYAKFDSLEYTLENTRDSSEN